jgi:hypothetical protein
MVEKSRAELEEMLARYAGRKITLVPETAPAPARGAEEPVPCGDGGQAGPGEEEAVLEDSLEAEGAQEAPVVHKAAGPRVVPAEAEPELKHLAKVFHGRIAKITKVK